MKITEIYLYLLYCVVIICSSLFIARDQYIIGCLLLLGNIWPGYMTVKTLGEKNED